MKLYIAGPMTGIDDYNRAAFHAAEQQLVESGYDVYNPATFLDSDDWKVCVRVGIRELTYCDGVALLPGWEDSRGVEIELQVAHALGMNVAELRKWNDV